MGSFLVAFAAVSGQQLVGLALGSRWGRPSPLAVASKSKHVVLPEGICTTLQPAHTEDINVEPG